ncbi:Fe-S-containing protein [Bifidobacterium aquikefiricola]|uniref:DUF2318 domain-containing protein n=1 Tax=Bifidobacterium aquikefiricola TaxID=3059038 RepID=A0AB39U714_9BIFI
MLEQFVTVMPGTLGSALLVMCLNVLLSVGEGRKRPRSAYWRTAGMLVGLLAAVAFAALRATAVITQRTFINYPTLVCCVVADLALIVVVVFARRITRDWNRHAVWLHVGNAVAGIAIAFTIFRALPDVILELTIFIEPGDPVFTSAMLLRALGFILGVAASIIVACMFRSTRLTAAPLWFTVATLMLLALTLVQHLTSLLTVMLSVGDIMLHGLGFHLLVWLINNAGWLIIAQVWVFIVPAIASVVAGFSMPVAAQNQADSRRHTAVKRRAMLSAAWTVIAAIGVTFALTYGVAQTNKQPVLSPPERYSLSRDTATIRYSQVEDGHLHRFQYTAKDGTVMRFIVIKKNGGAYGIGLDACDNCGDAGYYEKDGKIICKRCDVAINLATIGFRGGCNPIPFPYTTNHGAIVINTADLDALSSHFKS